MPNTFSQIYVQIVFAVKRRESLIDSSWEDELHKYISGIIDKKNQKLFAINGMPDHIHILLSLAPTCAISDLVREIKKSSTNFIKEKKFLTREFQWQEGYGVFSYNKSILPNVIAYIHNQKEHHKKIDFMDEFILF
ncbi:MAG TPA: IS200/IS605 family transposase [Bacteroidia bacterium]|jgi:REP element-mobilizing transposase RayT|nr:IS200/IS605 family transposase [Bacteroidia bacterium]